MALRFNKRIKIAPGIKINVGSKGITSTTIGGRGASINVGKKGSHLNAGLPGTGISTRTKLSGAKSAARKQVIPPVDSKPTTISEYFFGFVGICTIVGVLIWIY